MKTILFVLFFIFLVIPLVSANDLTIPFNKDYDLKRQCFNNGTYCSSSAVCNLTATYPTGNILVNNVEMTNQISFHNYTLSASQVNEFGSVQASVTCNDLGGDIKGNAFNEFTIEVTGDGLQSSQFPWQIIIGFLGLALIGVAKTREDLNIFQIMGSILMMVFGVATLYPGYSGINYSNLLGSGMGIVSIGVGFYFIIEGSFSRNEQVETYDSEDDGRFHG